MKPVFEFSGFLALALGAHVVVWQGNPFGTDGAAGQPGESAVAMSGANAVLQDIVAQWDAPPATSLDAPILAPPPLQDIAALPKLATADLSPEISAIPAPVLPRLRPEQPLVSDTPPPPPPKPVAQVTEPPKAKPKAKSKAAQKAKSPAKSTKGSVVQPPKTKGGAGAAGQSGTSAQASAKASAKASPALMARWGGAIRSSIEKRKRYPAGTRATGSVSLAITVATNGKLAGLSIARSSGDAALDRAAIDAVKRARLPKAPASIQAGSHRFTLSVAFDR